MVEKEYLVYFRYVHGSYNFLIMLMVFYAGTLGLRVRRARKAGSRASKEVRRHRRLGPFLAPLGVAGFFAGVILVMLDSGHVFEYPLHFAVGLLIALLVSLTFLVSRRIIGISSPWRNVHFTLGIAIVCLYLLQVFLGLGILL